MFLDYTNFENDNWNDWKAVANPELGLVTVGSRCLEYPTQSKVLLYKVVGIQPGKHYQLGARLRQRDSGNETQQVHFAVDQESLESWSVDSDAWKPFYTRFVGQRENPEVSLVYQGIGGPASSAKGLYIDDLLISEMDVTDFAEENMNGWQIRNDYEPKEFLSNGQEGTVLFLHTYPHPADHRGVFLHKPCNDLVAGASYAFEMRLGAQNALAPATLEAKFVPNQGAAVSIVGEVTVDHPGEWKTYSGTFIAPSESGNFTIENHTETGTGNDFMISELVFYRVIE